MAYLGTTCLVVIATTLAGWWYANRQSQTIVEERLRAIIQVVATPSYPLNGPVLRSIAGLSNAEIVLLDRQGKWVDGTQNGIPKGTSYKSPPPNASNHIQFDHRFFAPDQQIYHAAWRHFEPTSGMASNPDAFWIGVLVSQEDVQRQRWQILVLPAITGIALAISLATIAFWLTDRVVRRIQKMQRKVEQIAEGDYTPIEQFGPHDELHGLTESINRMSNDLRSLANRVQSAERERLIHALASGLSHDLRNTLTGARLALQLHQKTCHSDPESQDVAVRQLQLAEEQLVRWMTLSGEKESGAAQSVQAILDRIRQLVSPTADHHHCQFTLDCDGPTSQVSLPHGELVTSAVLNLVHNAIQAAGVQGWVRLRVELPDNASIRFEIIDNGPGPSAEMVDRMFDPLVTSKREGVGLGLTLVRRVAHQLRGRIEWFRREDCTHFLFELPRSRTDAA